MNGYQVGEGSLKSSAEHVQDALQHISAAGSLARNAARVDGPGNDEASIGVASDWDTVSSSAQKWHAAILREITPMHAATNATASSISNTEQDNAAGLRPGS